MVNPLIEEKLGPGEESVWDYPRPPRLEESGKQVQVFFNGKLIADSRRAMRVLETSHPPVYYIPLEDINSDCLIATPRSTICEYKGKAAYYSVKVGDRSESNAAWGYPNPTAPYRAMAGCIAFYPTLMDACLVDGERVIPQPGGFYGGWITHEIKGPFKGESGTNDW